MSSLPTIAVIAGGLATRMGEKTRHIAKSMLEVAGEPFIAHQLRLFRREGIERVVLCVGHFNTQIEDFVGDGGRFGLSVRYSADGETLLGTGGAIRRALPMLGDVFFVTYGDSYLDIAYLPVAEAFVRSNKRGLMTVLHNEGRLDTSNVEFDDGRLIAYSKQPTPRMKHIDFGLSMLRREAIANAPSDRPFDLSLLYAKLVKRGQMYGYEVTQRFYEIGSFAGLIETEAYIKTKTS
jgi:NDP-sugar pyrophosphorylase family protein